VGIAFRAEFFNLFNRNHWATPNTSVGSSTFGQVSSNYSGTYPRLIQFGLKFMFQVGTPGMVVAKRNHPGRVSSWAATP